MNKITIGCVVLVMLILFSWLVGYRTGVNSGAKQMARHILNPAFETESFYKIMGEECGEDKGWREMNGGLVFYKPDITIDGRCLRPEEKEYFTLITEESKK